MAYAEESTGAAGAINAHAASLAGEWRRHTGAATGATTSQGGGLQVAVRADPHHEPVSLLTGNTIAYNLCGIGGQNCAIGAGTPSSARLLLLRREALELALYTFTYVGGVQNVVAILPPGHSQQVATLSKKLPTSDGTSQPHDIAVPFERQELQPLLTQPLSASLPEPHRARSASPSVTGW